MKKLCEVCDCVKLCGKIAECGGGSIKCAEVRTLVEEIIEKNCNMEEKNA